MSYFGYDVPDHPVIRNMERTGYPDGKEPEYPHCPICYAEEIDTVYISSATGICGCPACVSKKDADQMPDLIQHDIATCPECDAQCDTVYIGQDSVCIGCDDCIREQDPWEQSECFYHH